MQLTDEQYNLIFRYADGQMDEGERIAFDAARATDAELDEELRIYIEIQSLAQSIEQKFNDASLTNKEHSSIADGFWEIKQARESWEQDHEPAMMSRLAFTPTGILDKGDGHKPVGANLPIAPDYRLAGERLPKKKAKLFNTTAIFRLLVAAVILCILLLGVLLWPSKRNEQVAMVTTTHENPEKITTDSNVSKTQNSKTVEPSTLKIVDTLNKHTVKKIPKLSVNDVNEVPSQNQSQGTGQNISVTHGDKAPNTQSYLPYTTKQTLFAANFRVDTLPTNRADHLGKAFGLYNAGDYNNAVLAFNKASVITRGLDESEGLSDFYKHYYGGLCYLAIDSATTAVKNLEIAVDASPDETWTIRSKWYLALALLKTSDVWGTKQLLGQILGYKDYNGLQRKAKNLLIQLERTEKLLKDKNKR